MYIGYAIENRKSNYQISIFQFPSIFDDLSPARRNARSAWISDEEEGFFAKVWHTIPTQAQWGGNVDKLVVHILPDLHPQADDDEEQETAAATGNNFGNETQLLEKVQTVT